MTKIRFTGVAITDYYQQ